MFSAINRFFEKLTRGNWGFPWHIWLSSLAAGFVFVLIKKWTGHVAYASAISLAIVNLGGLVYEIFQRRQSGNDTPDMIQDLIANNVGAIGQLLILAWMN
jgi:hypothetical protein